MDKRAGGDLYTHLRRQGKKYDKRRHGKSTRGQIRGRVSIDDRPGVVDDKSRVGDWEIDTIIGKGHSGALVTLVERVTNFTLAAQVDRKSAADVSEATIDLLAPFKTLVHTITADNRKEFAYHDQISEALDAEVYFAHTYSSWERGLNENTDGLLRQYFPKETDLKNVSQEQVNYAVERLNTRPRDDRLGQALLEGESEGGGSHLLKMNRRGQSPPKDESSIWMARLSLSWRRLWLH